jgi:hypothetical protein
MTISQKKESLNGDFRNPDQAMTPPNTEVAIVKLGDCTLQEDEIQAGWRWTKDIKPIIKTDFDPVARVAYVGSGRLRIKGPTGTGWKWGLTK